MARYNSHLRAQRNGLLMTGLAEIVFGAFFVIGGNYIPMVGPIWDMVGFGLMGLGVVFILMAFRSSRRLNRASALAATGMPGQALVLASEPTGVIINGVPSTRLDLEVNLADRPPYRVEGIKHSGHLAVNAWVPVVVSPENPENLVIAPTSMTTERPPMPPIPGSPSV